MKMHGFKCLEFLQNVCVLMNVPRVYELIELRVTEKRKEKKN
jgi:hypothetical protein